MKPISAGIPMTVLTKQTINTDTTMILDNPHSSVRQLASLLDISIGSAHTLLSTKFSISHVCSIDSAFTLTTAKKCLHWSVPISDRVGSQWHGLFEQYNHHRWDVYLLLKSHVQATDRRMDSMKFLSTKTTYHETKNEIHGYHILRSGRSGIHAHTVPDSQTVNANWYTEALKRLITMHTPHKRPNYRNGR